MLQEGPYLQRNKSGAAGRVSAEVEREDESGADARLLFAWLRVAVLFAALVRLLSDPFHPVPPPTPLQAHTGALGGVGSSAQHSTTAAAARESERKSRLSSPRLRRCCFHSTARLIHASLLRAVHRECVRALRC